MFIVNRLRGLFDWLPGSRTVTEVARYATVAGSAAGLLVPESAEFPISDRHITGINAPGIATDVPSVIFFRTTHSGSPAFSVRLNTTRLTQHTFTVASPHSWHEIIPAGALRAENNELTLNVVGDGSVRFSDIVFLYTSNKVDIEKELPPPVLTDQ